MLNNMLGGPNWIDGVIIILLIAAVVGSIRVGFLRLTFVIAGFFGALLLGGWLFPRILPIQDQTWMTIVNAPLILCSALYVAYWCYRLGQRLHWSFSNERFRVIESVLGVLPGLAATLVTIWLLAVMIGRLPFAGFSNSANDSLIVQALNSNLPPVPTVFTVFNRQISPNSPPTLFVEQPKPQPAFGFSPDEVESAAGKAAASTVRVTGFGCGGIVSGTGFTIAKDRVATNAHVVAGIKRPIVKHRNRSYEAIPILFDPRLDIAILKILTPVHPFAGRPLSLAHKSIRPDTTVAIAGFPGGNYALTPGIIRSDLVVSGRNIYDLGVVRRNIYQVQTSVDRGSSGGPAVLADGTIAGMVLAKYDTADDYAAVLTSLHVADALQKAKKSDKRVGTGVCLAE